MTNVPVGQEPERIDIAPDVHARKIGPFYHISFPFNEEAAKVMRGVATAHYAHDMKGWAARHEDVRSALIRIDQILGPERHDAPMSRAGSKATRPKRVVVSLAEDVTVGSILMVKDKPVTVDRLGVPFEADRRFAKWGRPELVGQTVRYAYHHPSTELELEAHRESRQDADPDIEMAP